MIRGRSKGPARLAVIGAPSSAGARLVGQEEAPGTLRDAGVVSNLGQLGFDVADHGDVARAVFRSDPGEPTAQNAEMVCRVVRDVAEKVSAADAEGAFPIVLGGDCSIAIGVVAGLVERGGSVGLIYFDGDLDLNTPETSPSGVFDGMVTAHLLGRGHEELAHIGPKYPLLEEAHLAYFGYNVEAGGVDPPELALLERSAALHYPVEVLRTEPLTAAREALALLERRVERILVHFDLDVTDAPAVDVRHRSGIPLDSALAVLEVFLASPKCAGLVFTELNPRLDPAGVLAPRLAVGLAEAFRSARSSSPGL